MPNTFCGDKNFVKRKDYSNLFFSFKKFLLRQKYTNVVGKKCAEKRKEKQTYIEVLCVMKKKKIMKKLSYEFFSMNILL